MARVLHAVVALALLALVLPAGAGAQSSIAPPGNSGIDEYRETVPDAAGGRTPRQRGEAGLAALTDAQRRRLERLGEDGRRLADVIEQTAPAAAEGGRAGREALPDSEGESPLRRTVEATLGGDDGDGLGLALPVILGLTFAAGGLVLLLRRRRTSE